MTVSVLLDTSYLITLIDRNRPHHDTAAKFYRLMLEEQIPMYFSVIAAAEFAIKQPITDLPLRNFRCIPFNLAHSNESARLWNALGSRDKGDTRSVVRDDVKLLGQASHELIPFVLTEDASTLFKYCDRLRLASVCSIRPIKLADGYDPSALRSNGQRELTLDDD